MVLDDIVEYCCSETYNFKIGHDIPIHVVHTIVIISYSTIIISNRIINVQLFEIVYSLII